MSVWKFILIDSSGDETEIVNPQGWDDIQVDIKRDDNWHGIFFSYAFSKLQFYGVGASLIKEEYEAKGVDGDMELSVLFQCSDGESYDEFYRGRLSFDEYQDTCGDECIVTIGLQDSNDIMLVRNNYEQQVDLNSNIAFDGITELAQYEKINVDIELISRGLPVRSNGSNTELQSFDLLDFPEWSGISGSGDTGTESGAFLPIFNTNTLTEVEDTNINAAPYYSSVAFNSGDQSKGTPPFLDLRSNQQLKCAPEQLNMKYRVKGRVNDITNASRIADIKLLTYIGQDPAHVFLFNSQVMCGWEASVPVTQEFDVSFDGVIPMQAGDKLYILCFIQYLKIGSAVMQFLTIEFDTETNIEFKGISYCVPTKSKSYFINEAVSRTVEAITNDKIRFYSTFFGRVDSQPYALSAQTCAGLFAISNGLNVRRRLMQDNTQPGCFVTLKQLFEELKAIWNIGLTIDPDLNRTGFNRLRFEDWRFFYQDEVGLIFNYPTKITRDVDTGRIYNKLTVGYNNWVAEQYSGLDEFMTKRGYRININAISKELVATSDIVVAPYTTEITRRLDTGTDDWKYDNDLFGFCLKSVGNTPEYSLETFADSAYGVQNVNDSNTCYNGRISPARIAMRWFSYFLQGVRNLTANSKLVFTGGEANYIAKFGLNNCNIESKPMQENEDIDLTDFDDPLDAKPLLFPETITFDHPLNFNLFNRIKNDPTLKFKAIQVNCNGSMIDAWIKSISYRPEEGQATIVAIPKNNSILPDVPEPVGCQASLVPDSVTMTGFDWEAGTAQIDFTEGNAGATLWSYIVTQGSNPGSGPGFSGTTTAHPFTVGGLTPGTWSVFIAPYCSPDDVGINFGAGTFNLPAPAFKIELSAVLTNFGSNNHLILTAKSIGNVPAPAGFSFQWGQCVYNTSISLNACRAFPSSPLPSPTNTLIFGAGQTTVSQQSVTVTAGSGYGYITKVVVHHLTGISSADIVKAAGQSWILDFE